MTVIVNQRVKGPIVPYKPTIAQEKAVFIQTGGHMNKDSEVLILKLMDLARRNSWDEGLVIEAPDYSQSTFSELTVPLTTKQARERYSREGVAAISPDFLQMLEKVKDYNDFCRKSTSSRGDIFSTPSYRNRGKEIKEIEITDFTNFLYFAEDALSKVWYHDKKKKSKIKKLFRGGKGIEETVEDPNPIVIMTNPEKDGLLDFFKEELMEIMQDKNRQLRIIEYGEGSSEALMEFYRSGFRSCFDAISVNFEKPSDEYSGIWINNSEKYKSLKGMSLEAKFLGKPDLLGVPNQIKGVWMSEGEYSSYGKYASYRSMLMLFNNLKNPKKEKSVST